MKDNQCKNMTTNKPNRPQQTNIKSNTNPQSKDNKPQPQTEKKTPKKDDPTKYGDWQINGRTIDF